MSPCTRPSVRLCKYAVPASQLRLGLSFIPCPQLLRLWQCAGKALFGPRFQSVPAEEPYRGVASLLAAAPEVRASRTWTGLVGRGRMALIDHRDVAEAGLRMLSDPALWGAPHDLTGPALMSWPEALGLLSAELGVSVTFRVATERQFLERLTGAGVPADR